MLGSDSTTGGAGGTTTTVSSLADLTAAVKGDAKKIVLVSGSITGTGSVKVGANTSLLGKSGACKIVSLRNASYATPSRRLADKPPS